MTYRFITYAFCESLHVVVRNNTIYKHEKHEQACPVQSSRERRISLFFVRNAFEQHSREVSFWKLAEIFPALLDMDNLNSVIFENSTVSYCLQYCRKLCWERRLLFDCMHPGMDAKFSSNLFKCQSIAEN